MNPNFSTTQFIKTTSEVAEHFGFQPCEQYKKHPRCKKAPKAGRHTATAKDRKQDAANGLLTNGLPLYSEHRLHALNDTPLFTYSIDAVPRTNDTAITLHVFHVKKSIAEALLLHSIQGIVRELGYAQFCVRLNSIGDSDSLYRYNRELTTFLRKRIDHLPPAARELMKEHPYLALMHMVEKDHELSYKAPSPLEYLSDTSRKHFREVVEYLDMTNTPYEIDPKLLGHHACYSDALFAFDLYDDDFLTPLPDLHIRGGRYDTFMEQHTEQPIPAAGAVLTFSGQPLPNRLPRIKRQDPTVSVVQLGFGPKVRTLTLINELRRAGIPTTHRIADDSLSEQLRKVEAEKIPYSIIIGQKEYVEGTVILRDMNARNQETVQQDKLLPKLKRVAKARA
jgi:histidyl-tRNA synthetase